MSVEMSTQEFAAFTALTKMGWNQNPTATTPMTTKVTLTSTEDGVTSDEAPHVEVLVEFGWDLTPSPHNADLPMLSKDYA